MRTNPLKVYIDSLSREQLDQEATVGQLKLQAKVFDLLYAHGPHAAALLDKSSESLYLRQYFPQLCPSNNVNGQSPSDQRVAQYLRVATQIDTNVRRSFITHCFNTYNTLPSRPNDVSRPVSYHESGSPEHT